MQRKIKGKERGGTGERGGGEGAPRDRKGDDKKMEKSWKTHITIGGSRRRANEHRKGGLLLDYNVCTDKREAVAGENFSYHAN